MNVNPSGVLIVDYAWLARATMAVLVKNAGYRPLLASNAEETIGLLDTRQDIRLVITEIALPGTLDGTMLLHLVRERWPQIHLMVVTGVSAPHTLGLPKGVRVFRKPYTYMDLATYVQRQLREPDED